MRRGFSHPVRLVPIAFLAAIALGTLLLMLPAATAGAERASLLTALFTSTSAVCVTGLIVVDTPVYWSTFGQVVILALFQIGGFGLMTGASLLGLLVTRRLGLGRRVLAQAETRAGSIGDIASVVRFIAAVTIVVESMVTAILALQLHYRYGEPWPLAIWNGFFQAVSAFNNAGFSTYSDSLMGFVADPIILMPIMVAIVIGGLGFPVLAEILKGPRTPSGWSLHTKITLAGTAILLLVGMVAIAAYEWTSQATLGRLEVGDRLLAAAFHSVTARTAGFNTLDVGAMAGETLAVHYGLMLVGGGSASTAGGIKVTTFFLLGFVVWAEIRGEPDSSAFRRRIPGDVQRQALTVVLIALAMIGIATLVLMSATDFALEPILFEVISAFSTVGLSTGITAALPPAGQACLIVLMFVGRAGTITVATALALRSRCKSYRYPEERPLVG